jgi:hypothetical protein
MIPPGLREETSSRIPRERRREDEDEEEEEEEK